MTSPYFSQDIQDVFALLSKHKVRYLIVGAEAVIYYGYARLTGDIDIFFDPSPKNCRALFSALREFWAGPVPGIEAPVKLTTKGTIFQFGFPPNRIDLINKISGVGFPEAWRGRSPRSLLFGKQSVIVHYIGLAALIKNKKACGRPKDMEDLKYLQEAAKKACLEADLCLRSPKKSSKRSP